MSERAGPRTGGRILADAMVRNGVERAFCVPGESYLALLDALYDSPIAVTVARQEGGAAMMAEAWGKLTGRPGIVMATRGPGATNASAGLHVGAAGFDADDPASRPGRRGACAAARRFRRSTRQHFFGEVAKWVEEIDSADRIPEIFSRAMHMATSGRPGPVVLSLPEDMLRETATVADAAPWVEVETHPGPDADGASFGEMLSAAKKPFVILGGSRWSEAAVAGIRRFAERFDLPVGCSLRRQMLFDHDHPNYAGDVGIGINPALAARVKEADVLLLIGGRMSEMPSSGYTLIDIPEPAPEAGPCPSRRRGARPRLSPGARDQCQPDRLRRGARRTCSRPRGAIAWAAETRAANEAYRAWSTPKANPGPVQLGPIVTWLRERLPDDAIVTNGAGNYTGWVHRFFRFRRFNTQLAPTSGSMGYGLPAAIAAKLRYPERMVVAFAGDGCFQMTGQEFATAVQYERGGRSSSSSTTASTARSACIRSATIPAA